MTPLTGLDASFLYLETAEMPMHVGSFNLCELPPGFKGSFHKAVTRHIAQRMHLAPVFSRRLMSMPLNLGHPAWVEADSVDVNFHVRRADPGLKGGAPMTLAQAHAVVAQLHSEPIDRHFPLWEFYVFDRIQLPPSQGGQLVAGFFSKIHHAALDGKAGVMLANAILDLEPLAARKRPAPESDHAGPRSDDTALTPGKLLGSVLSSSFGQVAKLARALPSAVRTLGAAVASQSLTASAAGARPRTPIKLAPHTPFNIGLGSERVFVTATLPLKECKALGKAVGGSLNDIVLWVCSTALRDYLLTQHSLPRQSLVAAMPVSLRAQPGEPAADAASLGNQVSMSLVTLGTHIANPIQRMNAILASTAKVKSSFQSLKGLLPTDYPSLLAPWLVGGVARQLFNAYGKSGLPSRLPTVVNLAISNVPGPPVPLYLAGARLLSFHPLSIIVHGVALNITVQTYAGQIDFGIVADKAALPHPEALADAVLAAFKLAHTVLASSAAASPAPPKTAAQPENLANSLKTSVKTRKTAVTKVTQPSQLESSPSVKRRQRPDTETQAEAAYAARKTSTSKASSHAKSINPTVSEDSGAPVRRKTRAASSRKIAPARPAS